MEEWLDWLEILESKIFSRIKNDFPISLKEKYPTLEFTTKEKSEQSPVLPNIYIHLLAPVEQGMDLENKVISGANITVQIKVTTNGEKKQAKDLAYGCILVLKEMRFTIIALPEVIQDTKDTAVSNIRASRIIGCGENF